MSREAIGAGRPVPDLAQAAQKYAAHLGSSRLSNFKGIYIVASLTEAIAQAYNCMPLHDVQALAAYRAMRQLGQIPSNVLLLILYALSILFKVFQTLLIPIVYVISHS